MTPLSVPCPWCQAPAGEHCRTAMGTIDRSNNPHQARIDAAKRAAKKAGDPAQGSLLFDVPVPTVWVVRSGVRWDRQGPPGKIGARYHLLDGDQDTGYRIEHCGHPTANFPYIGYRPDGELITAKNGRGFMKLAFAQADILTAYLNDLFVEVSGNQMKEAWIVTKADAKPCPLCGALAVVELPQWLKDKQPDTTTHVCHPALDGCNHGFGPVEEKPEDTVCPDGPSCPDPVCIEERRKRNSGGPTLGLGDTSNGRTDGMSYLDKDNL
jgi:hypothetical protein